MNVSDTMRCPRCDCPEFAVESYDFGIDPDTGYRNSGVRARCASCGLEADVEDFQPQEKVRDDKHSELGERRSD